MKSDKVVERLCELAREVTKQAFNWKKSADCICTRTDVAFDEAVLSFIETAVREKLNKQ